MKAACTQPEQARFVTRPVRVLRARPCRRTGPGRAGASRAPGRTPGRRPPARGNVWVTVSQRVVPARRPSGVPSVGGSAGRRRSRPARVQGLHRAAPGRPPASVARLPCTAQDSTSPDRSRPSSSPFSSSLTHAGVPRSPLTMARAPERPGARRVEHPGQRGEGGGRAGRYGNPHPATVAQPSGHRIREPATGQAPGLAPLVLRCTRKAARERSGSGLPGASQSAGCRWSGAFLHREDLVRHEAVGLAVHRVAASASGASTRQKIWPLVSSTQ